MNKKFLIIGNQAPSIALKQVLSLFTTDDWAVLSHDNHPSIGDFLHYLEGYQGASDLDGIMLNGSHGVELLKHIRLSAALGRLTYLPAAVIGPESLTHHLKEKLDNILLVSPGCSYIQSLSCIPGLLSTLDELRPFESQESMWDQIKSFIVWSKEDDIVSRHDNMNRYGPLKLMKELFDPLPDYLSREHREIASRLWFKKNQFLESQLPPVTKTIDEEQYRRVVANKKILLIDDEHRLGWSFALYSLITGKSDSATYRILLETDHVIQTPDGRFACIDAYDEAVSFFESYDMTVTKALSEYSVAEDLRNRSLHELCSIQQRFKEAETKHVNARANLERSQVTLSANEEKLKDLDSKLESSIVALAEEYIKAPGDLKPSQLGAQLKDVSDVYEQYSKAHKSVSLSQQELKQNKETHENFSKDFSEKQKLLKQAESKKLEASRRYDDAMKALVPGVIFPFDLVILDLRLERVTDKDALPQEISGVKVLRKIKEFDPSIPVLVFTASEKAMNYKEVIELGASGYWVKAASSLAHLKNELIKSLSKTQDMRSLWLDIKKVEAKRELFSVCASRPSGKLMQGIINESKKDMIVTLLKESFLLLFGELTPYEELVCNYNNYAKVALNMGLIHEERIIGIPGEHFDLHIKKGELDPAEKAIRQTRNRAAHRTGSSISYEEGLDVFQKTLKLSLRPLIAQGFDHGQLN